MKMSERVRDYVKQLSVGDSAIYQDNQEFYRGVVRLVDGGEIFVTGIELPFSRETSYAPGDPDDQPPRIMYPTDEIREKLQKHEDMRTARDAFAALFDHDIGFPDRFLRSAWSSLCRARDGEFPEGRLQRSEYLSEIREMLDDELHYDMPIRKVREMVVEASELGIR